MAPLLSSHDAAALRRLNPELCSEGDVSVQAGGVEFPNRDDCSRSQLGPTVSFSGICSFRVALERAIIAPGSRAPLGYRVMEVVRVGAKEQVSRVTTGGKIATMTDKKRRGIFAVPEFEGEAVSENLPMLSCPAVTEPSVALRVEATLEGPTGILAAAPVDERPQSFCLDLGNFLEQSRLIASHAASYSGCKVRAERRVAAPLGSLNYPMEGSR